MLDDVDVQFKLCFRSGIEGVIKGVIAEDAEMESSTQGLEDREQTPGPHSYEERRPTALSMGGWYAVAERKSIHL